MFTTAALTAAVVPDIGRSLREGLLMLWETFWPLVLGFGLSGAVQAFVSREDMQRALGNHRPAALLRASGFGMASSSCSYAASAMAKSLFQKGADFVSALVFMFASTNLVIELGVVLVVLMGWQFAAAEFVGGAIMILLLAVFGGLVLRPALVEAARARLNAAASAGSHISPAPEGRRGRPSLTSRRAWSDAAGYTVADLTMLRREIVIGYLVAGFLATVVPTGVWNAVFLHGHGFWTALENALVGPPLALVSFVCSIGNVPMAAALWKGGISFGGVVSFIFADLVAAPLVLVYRRYYGGALTLRLVGLFWAVMAAAGLMVEGIFSAAGLTPRHRPGPVVATSFRWNYTTGLDAVFLVVLVALYWLHRHRDRPEGAAELAIDPVCGMQVRTADAPARTAYQGRTWWFCSDHCAERFSAQPDRYIRSAQPAQTSPDHRLQDDEW